MRIYLDQPIAVSAEAAQAAFVDPAFYQSLGELAGISAPEVRSFSQSQDRVHLALGYRFAGELNGPAKRLLDPQKLTWSQITDVDLRAGRTEVRMVPDNYRDLLSFSAWYELRSEGESNCVQHFEGDLRVRLPLLGPLAERAIGGSIRQNIAETAHLVERYAGGRNATGGQAGRGKAAGVKAPGGKPGGGKAGDGMATGGKVAGRKAGVQAGAEKTGAAKSGAAKSGRAKARAHNASHEETGAGGAGAEGSGPEEAGPAPDPGD